MSVASLGEYKFKPADALENFKGKQLLYISWEKHRMFSRPMVLCMSPDTLFSEILNTTIPDAYSLHPDFEKIDWDKVTWIKSNESWVPDPSKSLADNGITHKELMRFTTPGLNGLLGYGA
jgi:phenol hydroxylase P4 protein